MKPLVTDWIIAIAIVLQFVVAATVALLTRSLIVVTRKYVAEATRMADEMSLQRRRESDELVRRHAVQVSAWLESFVGQVSHLRGVLRVQNGGDQPIYNITFRLSHPRYHDESGGKRVVPPGTTLGKSDWTMKALDTQEDQTIQVGDVAVELEFSDAEGRHWRRTDSGNLVLLESRKS